MNALKIRTYGGYAIAGSLVGIAIVMLATGRGSGPASPPPQAIAACEKLDEWDDCAVTLRGRNLMGTCVHARQQDELLICLPQGGPIPDTPEGPSDE